MIKRPQRGQILIAPGFNPGGNKKGVICFGGIFAIKGLFISLQPLKAKIVTKHKRKKPNMIQNYNQMKKYNRIVSNEVCLICKTIVSHFDYAQCDILIINA